MNTTSRSIHSSSSRLKLGAAVLAAAEVVDTKLVATRLTAFAEAQLSYFEAERKVDDAETRLEAEKLKVAQLGADHDDALEALARCLVSEGQPRSNPFDAFGTGAPSAIKRMAPAEAAKACRALVASVQRNKELSAPTLEAAGQVEKATEKVEAGLGPVETLREEVRAARRMAEVIARNWHDALSALRRGARAAADEGAPGLYAALFTTGSRSPKRAKVAPQPPAETAPAAPAAPAS